MAFSLLRFSVVLLVSLPPATLALQVAPGSSCASVCLDLADGDPLEPSASTTNSSDVVCNDVDYFSSATGIKYKKCVECLQTSGHVEETETDVSWFLYNLRYASSVCLFDFPGHKNTSTTPCDLEAACKPLQGALEDDGLVPANKTDYGYCSADEAAFYGSNIDSCVSCLQLSPQSYLANFLIALHAGCEQQPTPGVLLGISGDIFSSYPVNITRDSNTEPADSADQGPVLSRGAIGGIVAGVVALLLIAIILFFIYWRRQKQSDYETGEPSHFLRTLHLREKYHAGGFGESHVTVASNEHYAGNYTVDYKTQFEQAAPAGPRGPYAHEAAARDCSSNAEYYDRTESQSRSGSRAGSMQSGSTLVNSTSALPTHHAYIPRGHFGGRPSRTSSPNPNAAAVPGSSPHRSKADSFEVPIVLNEVDEVDEVDEHLSPPGSPPTPPPESLSDPAQRFTHNPHPAAIFTHGTPSPPQPQLAGLQAVPPHMPASNAEQPAPPQAHEAGSKPRSNKPLSSALSRGTQLAGPIGIQHQQQQYFPPPPSHPPPISSSLSSASIPCPPPPAQAPAPPRIPSLILPTVPRMRIPKKYRPPQVEAGRAPRAGGISGPLAFPDSRFATQSGDRIVEQTINRGREVGETPIGSGKSYLYG